MIVVDAVKPLTNIRNHLVVRRAAMTWLCIQDVRPELFHKLLHAVATSSGSPLPRIR